MGATLGYSPIEQILRVIDPTYREFILLKYKSEAEEVLARQTDERCDIYSLGATFYHLLTGQPPIDSPKRSLELWGGNKDPLINPSILNPNIPPAISACLLKEMEIERDNRFSLAMEMQIVLKNGRTDKFLMPDVSDAQTEVITAESNVPWNLKTGSSQTTVALETKNRTVNETNGKSFTANNLSRLSLAVALLAMTTVGVAAWVFINSAKLSDTPETTITNTPPIISATVARIINPEPTPDNSPNLVPNQSVEKVTKSSKMPVATPVINEKSKPLSTKKPAQTSPKPKPTEDPNCVFTNSCRN